MYNFDKGLVFRARFDGTMRLVARLAAAGLVAACGGTPSPNEGGAADAANPNNQDAAPAEAAGEAPADAGTPDSHDATTADAADETTEGGMSSGEDAADDGDPDATDGQEADASDAGGVNAPPLTIPARTWTWIDVPESSCDDGSPTGFGVNPSGDPSSGIFFFFEGGGACWDYETCFVENRAVHGPRGAAQWSAPSGGWYDRGSTSNPFRESSYVYVPYCTGDIHAGDVVTTYQMGSTSRPYHHTGRLNALAMVARVAATWPRPSRVVVTGSSAGGGGATLDYDFVRGAFPDARGYLISDSGPFLEKDGVSSSLRAAWYASWRLGDDLDPICSGCRDDLSLLYSVLAARHDADRMGLDSAIQDTVICSYYNLTPAQFQNDLLTTIADRFTPTVGVRAFLVAGTNHTFFGNPYVQTKGTTLLSWITTMVTDGPGWDTVQP